jgi:tRNA pseudouridine55 synthase
MAHASVPVKPLVGDGVLNVRKAAGWTSHDVVAKLRSVLHGPRIGHAGTLDPSATGVLPVLVGKATRIAEYLQEWDKEYRAVLRLGETTDTLDASGTILMRRSAETVTEAAVRSAVARFEGRTTQIPPMYSAVKVAGVPLYKSARAGKTIPRGPRDVTIHRLEILGISGPDVSLHVGCSKGTYVRTLCADIGEALGVGGHLLTLDRVRVGPLRTEGALTVEEIIGKAEAGSLQEVLLSLDDALAGLPALQIEAAAAGRARHGVPVPLSSVQRTADLSILRGDETVRLKEASGRLIALGAMPAVEGTEDGDHAERKSIRIMKVLVGASDR